MPISVSFTAETEEQVALLQGFMDEWCGAEPSDSAADGADNLPAGEKPKRKRRTKAEIEADAKAKIFSEPSAPGPVQKPITDHGGAHTSQPFMILDAAGIKHGTYENVSDACKALVGLIKGAKSLDDLEALTAHNNTFLTARDPKIREMFDVTINTAAAALQPAPAAAAPEPDPLADIFGGGGDPAPAAEVFPEATLDQVDAACRAFFAEKGAARGPDVVKLLSQFNVKGIKELKPGVQAGQFLTELAKLS